MFLRVSNARAARSSAESRRNAAATIADELPNAFGSGVLRAAVSPSRWSTIERVNHTIAVTQIASPVLCLAMVRVRALSRRRGHPSRSEAPAQHKRENRSGGCEPETDGLHRIEDAELLERQAKAKSAEPAEHEGEDP